MKKDIYINGPCPPLPFDAIALFPIDDIGGNAWHVLVSEVSDPDQDWEKTKDAVKVKTKKDLDNLPAALKHPDGKPKHMFADKTEFPADD